MMRVAGRAGTAPKLRLLGRQGTCLTACREYAFEPWSGQVVKPLQEKFVYIRQAIIENLVDQNHQAWRHARD